jgi:hypothetical protein
MKYRSCSGHNPVGRRHKQLARVWHSGIYLQVATTDSANDRMVARKTGKRLTG